MKGEKLTDITIQMEAEVYELNDKSLGISPIPSSYSMGGEIYRSPKELLRDVISQNCETRNERWCPSSLFKILKGFKLGETVSLSVHAGIYRKE